MGLSIKHTIRCNIACVGCFVPGTLILMKDFSWRSIEEIQEGDVLWGFDETPKEGNRKFTSSTVLHVHREEAKEVLDTVTEGSFCVSSTPEHQFLAHTRWQEAKNVRLGNHTRVAFLPHYSSRLEGETYKRGYVSGAFAGDGHVGIHGPYHQKSKCGKYEGDYYQRVAQLAAQDEDFVQRVAIYLEDLGVLVNIREFNNGGSKLPAVICRDTKKVAAISDLCIIPPDPDVEFMRGFVAGIYDAEGSLCGGACIRITNTSKWLVELVAGYMQQFEFATVVEKREAVQAGRKDCYNLRLKGRAEKYRFFSVFNTAAMRKVPNLEGVSTYGRDRVVQQKLRSYSGTVYDLTTTSRTYIANGFLVHNCYQNPTRDVGNDRAEYDIEAIIQAVDQSWKPGWNVPTLHGGEPLLMHREDLDQILKYIYTRAVEEAKEAGKTPSYFTSIQTNGLLIDDEVIAMFKKYKTSVGISIDGPDADMNRSRQSFRPKDTAKDTQKVLDNLKRLTDEGISAGVIICLHKYNCDDEHRPRLIQFIRELREDYGICNGRLNPLEFGPSHFEEMSASAEDIGKTWCDVMDLTLSEPGYHWTPMRDAIDNIIGFGPGTCVHDRCDVTATRGEQVINSKAEKTNCMHIAFEGVDWLTAADPNTDENKFRYDILRDVPHKYGGCFGGPDGKFGSQPCKWWLVCAGGGCLGSALGQDIRNKSRFCASWDMLFQYTYDRLKALFPNIRLAVDEGNAFTEQAYKSWQQANMGHEPFFYMLKENTARPSTHRGKAYDAAYRKPGEVKVEVPKKEVQQGNVGHVDWHLDSLTTPTYQEFGE